MYAINNLPTISTYANAGQRAEQNLAYMLTGELRSHDHVAYDVDSDIPEYHMSVKSSKFTLVSGNKMTAQDFEGQLNEYFSKVASTCVAYVTEENIAYVMDMNEFREMLIRFAKLTSESAKNGGKNKIRFCAESKKVREWLAERSAN